MSDHMLIDFVGGFWCPSKLSQRRCKKAFDWAMRKLGPGAKPHVRFFSARHTGDLYMAVYRRTEEGSV